MWWRKTCESVIILKEYILIQPQDLQSLMPVGANYTSSNANPLHNPPQPLQGPRVQPTEILPRVHNLIVWKNPSLPSPLPRPESEDPLHTQLPQLQHQPDGHNELLTWGFYALNNAMRKNNWMPPGATLEAAQIQSITQEAVLACISTYSNSYL